MGDASESVSTFIVTGASRGIGLATAEKLAAEGERRRIVLVCRDADRGRAALTRVQRAAVGSPTNTGELLIADLSSQQSIRRLAAEIDTRYPRLDVLIHNAGVITLERRLTEDGIETQLAVNHLAPFLLTHLLRPALAASQAGRVVVVASQVERHGTIRFDDLQGEQGYQPLEAYYQSKLANVLFTYALAARWKGPEITVNCLHPGVVRSSLLDNFKTAARSNVEARSPVATPPAQLLRGALRLGRGVVRTGLRRLMPRKPDADDDGPLTPEQGAAVPAYVATAPELAGVSGRYFREVGEAQTSPASYDRGVQDQLWAASAALVGLG